MSARRRGIFAAIAVAISLLAACGGDAPPPATPKPPQNQTPEDLPPSCPGETHAQGRDTTAIEGAKIAKICFVGAPPEIETELRKMIVEHEGDVFSLEKARNDVPTLFKSGRLDDARITAVPAGAKGIILEVDVKLLPKIAELSFQGATALNEAALAKAFPLKAGSTLYHSQLKVGIRALEEAYQEHGYPNAHATVAIDPDAGGVRVRIDIEEGSLVTVKKIAFTGLAKIKEAELLKVIEQKTGEAYVADRTYRDELLISQYLFDHGLVNSRVDSKPVITGDSIAITFTIVEGPVFKIGSIHLAGESLGDEKDILKSFESKKNAVFSRGLLLKDIQALKTSAQARGLDVDITPETDLNPAKQTADFVLRVTKATHD